MRVLIIGGTGHIGTYLVPLLVRAGHAVGVVSRGQRSPYTSDDAWDDVELIRCDRTAEEANGDFGRRLARWQPDAVVDLTCFTPEQATRLVEALDGQHLVTTGSIWAWGPSLQIPMTEESPKRPLAAYGKGKAAIEEYLLRGQQRVRATVIHPGHISGPGWAAINPAGNLNLEVYRRLRRDGTVLLPDNGMALLQHVHAADVAALHVSVLARPEVAAGEAFNSVAEQSLTLRGYATLVARHFGHEPTLAFLPWLQFAREVGPDNARLTADHIQHSPHHSMGKARELLGFSPSHSAADTVLEALDALVAARQV